MVQKLNYHLYMEFWSSSKKKDHILLIIERDFKTIDELRIANEHIQKSLGGEF